MNKPTTKPTPTAMIIECLRDVADNHLYREGELQANACVCDAADRLEQFDQTNENYAELSRQLLDTSKLLHKTEAEAEALHLQLLQLKAKHGEAMSDQERQKLVDFHRECAGKSQVSLDGSKAITIRPAGYFSYCTEADYQEHSTKEEAIEAAKSSIDDFQERAASDGWPEEVERICWGVVVERAEMCNKRPSDNSDFDYICDYALIGAEA